jgi:hypothetical protein
VAAAPVQAGPPGYTPLLTGQAQDGRWELSAKLHLGGNGEPCDLEPHRRSRASRARSVVVGFRDGARLRVRARPAVRGWSRLLGTRVRYFAADALAKTAARPRRVLVYDGRGRRIGRSHVGSPPSSGSRTTAGELPQ